MQKRWISKFFLGAVISGALVLTGCYSDTPEERVDRATDYVADELELNETQTEQFRSSATRLMDEGSELKDLRFALLDEVIYQLQQDQVDQARLGQSLAQAKEGVNTMLDMVNTEFVALHTSLDSEQRQMAIEHLEKMKSKVGERRGFYGKHSSDH